MANEMRDRLVELIRDYNQGRGRISPEDLADHLIENGVIVPPCKVGDTVYSFCETFGVVLPYFVESLHIAYYDENSEVYQYEANCTNDECDELLDSIDFEIDDIGKTVFLTKEQAEQKLKEMRGNNV